MMIMYLSYGSTHSSYCLTIMNPNGQVDNGQVDGQMDHRYEHGSQFTIFLNVNENLNYLFNLYTKSLSTILKLKY